MILPTLFLWKVSPIHYLLTDFKISNILVNYFSVQHGTIQLTL